MADLEAPQTAELLRTLAREIVELRLQLQYSQPGDSTSASRKASANIAAVQKAWHRNIHSFRFPPEADCILDAFLHESTLQLQDLVRQPSPGAALQPWFTSPWMVTYPTLRDFLATCRLDESSKASLALDSFSWDSLSHQRAYFRNFIKPEKPNMPNKHAELWDLLRTRATDQNIGEATDVADRPGTVARLGSLIPSRTMRITDLSPLLSSIVLASHPRFNQNIVAAFFDRYLAGASSGRALLRSWSRNVTQRHAFVFEYHLSFVYVPNVLVDPELPTLDFRRLTRPDGSEFHLRRANAFSISSGEPSRWIYEEQCSCLISGCGPRIQTSIQLAENYYTGPFVRSYGRRMFPTVDNQPRPACMFLDWLQYSMHLVNGRWQQAIDAVNSCIHTSADIIFVDDHHDLLSDDPQFSRSKTYFWALQAYKMFDEKLSATIDAWNDFRDNRLIWVNDGLFGDEWDTNIGQIQNYVDALAAKRTLIRSKSEEVRHLREGLFGASSLFDSRTAVRQGDNIRLLTWITILFFPLTFCTSIFGMQVVLPELPIRVLIITMPCVFIGTAFILFNTSYLMEYAERLTRWTTDRLRIRMKGHHHQTWKTRLEALQRDRQNQEAPVRRVQRQGSHWTYAVFAVTLLLFDLPVHEVEWALSRFWLIYKFLESKVKPLPQPPSTDPESASSPGPSRASSHGDRREAKAAESHGQAREIRDVRQRTRILRRARKIRTIFSRGIAKGDDREDKKARLARFAKCLMRLLLSICRTMLLLIWLPLVIIEYIILLPLVTLDPFHYFSGGSGNLHGSPFKQPLQWLGIGVEYKFEEVRASKISTFKQAVITWRKQQDLWEASDGPIGNLPFRRLRQRRPPPPPPPAQDGPRGSGMLSGAIAGGLARTRSPDRPRSSSAMGRLARGRGSNTDLRSLNQASPGYERGRSRQGHTLNVPAHHDPGTPTEERLSPGWRPPLSRSLSRLRSHPDQQVRIEVSRSS